MKNPKTHDQHTIEKALRESNALVENIAATTSDLITIQEADTNRIIYRNYNDFWKDLLDADVYGLPEEERATAMIHPDHLSNVKSFLEERKYLHDRELREAEIKLTNGNWIQVRSKIFQRDQNGEAELIISFTRNITRQKKAEQAERAIREAEERKAFLLKLSDALRSLSNPLEIQRAAINIIGEHLQVDRAFYTEFSPDGNDYYIADNYVRAGIAKRTGRFSTSVFPSMIQWFARGETPVSTTCGTLRY
ncbi:MAG TPA: hypothetical protein VGK59_11570 [Ohtaekwangia sp.]